MPETSGLRLDDLYRMTAFIYSDRNSVRSKDATFAHFVEVCGMLTLYDRKKKREGIDFSDALCKALGWYFPLLAKLQIKSVERLIYRKFPGVCPYCRLAPHEDQVCKLVQGTERTVNHKEVVRIFKQTWDARPKGLNEWQRMFNKVYPRSVSDSGRSTIGITEELGELAEAVRVFDMHPHYFLGEAADIFSYIMGFANEFAIREAQDDRVFSFEAEYLARYPGLCTQCGSRMCVCPAIPSATVGRMAKELDIAHDESPFISDASEFLATGQKAAHAALEYMGGYSGLTNRFPFDRGDANHALVQLCLKIADGLGDSGGDLANSLRAEAVKLGSLTKDAGTPREPMAAGDLMETLRALWRDLGEARKNEIKATKGLVGDLGEMLDSVRVLFVYCDPTAELGLHAEQRAVREAIKSGPHGTKISVEDLPAATVDDLRRALLRSTYDIIHFSGHANEEVLVFESASNEAAAVPLVALAELISHYPSVKCVILNACESVKKLKGPISPITIGMDADVLDGTAKLFSRGFYDALAAGHPFRRAYSEGILTVKLDDRDSDLIRILPDK